MTLSAATSGTAAALPHEVLLLVAIAAVIAAAVGFAVGYGYARLAARWSLHRARHHVSRLYAMTLETLDTAQRTCSLLERCPDLLLSVEQTSRLDSKRSKLMETVQHMIEQQRKLEAARQALVMPLPAPHVEAKRAAFAVEWQRLPVDDSSGLPDRSAFEANLERLVRASKEAETDCGLLLVKLDKFDQLMERHRRAGAEEFLKRLAGVVCRTVRDEELVTRYNRDTLAVLMPAIDAQAGGQLAGTIRDRVRSYQFRLDATGPEVLVTASFGYTRLFPGDTAELALNRAGSALERSCGRGRNQLHVHDGSDVTHCLAG